MIKPCNPTHEFYFQTNSYSTVYLTQITFQPLKKNYLRKYSLLYFIFPEIQRIHIKVILIFTLTNKREHMHIPLNLFKNFNADVNNH